MVRRVIAASGLLFMVPAVLVNIEVGLGAGRSYAQLSAAIAMVLGAGVAGIVLSKALEARAISIAALAGAVLVMLTTMNVVNALGLASHDRSERRTLAKTAVDKVRNLDDQRRTLEDAVRSGSQTLQGLNSQTLQGQVDAKMLQPFYGRSKSCSDVTLPESRVACGEFFTLRGQLEAVKKLDLAREDLRTIRELLNSTSSAPDSVDAQAENLLSVLSLFMIVPGDASKGVGQAVNVMWALCIEIMASFMPGLVAFGASAVPLARRTQADAKPVKPVVEKKPTAEIPASCAAFFGERIVRRSGVSTGARDLLSAYELFCGEKDFTPVSQRALGLAMVAAGFKKERSGNVRYIGVTLRTVRPELKLVGVDA